jgi:hypothetical protein
MIRFLSLLILWLCAGHLYCQSLEESVLHSLEKRFVEQARIVNLAVDQLLEGREQTRLSIDFLVIPPLQFKVEQEKGFISRVENLLSAKVFAESRLSYVRNQLESLEQIDLSISLRFQLTTSQKESCLEASVDYDGAIPFLNLTRVCSQGEAAPGASADRLEYSVGGDTNPDLSKQASSPGSSIYSNWWWILGLVLGGGAVTGFVFQPRKEKAAQQKIYQEEESVADETLSQIEVFKSLKALQVFHRSQGSTTSPEEAVFSATITPQLAFLNANLSSVQKIANPYFYIQGRNQQVKTLSESCRDLSSLLRSMQKNKEGITAPMKKAFLTMAPQSLHLNVGVLLQNLLNEPEMQALGTDRVEQLIGRDVLLRIQTSAEHSAEMIKSYMEDLSELLREWLGNSINNAIKANGNSVKMRLEASDEGGLLSLRFQNTGVACPEQIVELVNRGNSNALARKKGRETGYPEIINSIQRLWDLEEAVLGELRCRLFLQNLEGEVESRIVWSKPVKSAVAEGQLSGSDQIKDLLVIEDEFEEKFETLKESLQGLDWVVVKSQQEAFELLAKSAFKRVVLDANYLLRPGDEFAETEMEHLSEICEQTGDAELFLFSSDLEIQEQWAARCKDSGQRVNMSGRPEDLEEWLES